MNQGPPAEFPLPAVRPLRVLCLAVGLGVVVLAAWWLTGNGPGSLPLRCLFHDWTGLHCPGCGMTRASHALFNGRIGEAIGFNSLGMLLLPIGLVGVGLEAQGWIRGVRPKWRLPLGRYGAITIVVTVIGFTLLRNLPWWPFSLLAP